MHDPITRVLVDAVLSSGLSQSELARRARLARSTVTHALNGDDLLSLDNWARLLKAARVELGYRAVSRPLTDQELDEIAQAEWDSAMALLRDYHRDPRNIAE